MADNLVIGFCLFAQTGMADNLVIGFSSDNGGPLDHANNTHP